MEINEEATPVYHGKAITVQARRVEGTEEWGLAFMASGPTQQLWADGCLYIPKEDMDGLRDLLNDVRMTDIKVAPCE